MRELCNEGSAIFFSTHVLEVAEKLCDKIAIIKDGKIVAVGSTEQVKGNNSLEEVFNDLTGFEDHSLIADKFIKVIKEV